MAPRSPRPPALDRLVNAALTASAGPCIVLDQALRIRLASDSAEEILGCPIPTGTPAPTLLCGDKPTRPVAEALAAGQPVHAVIPRPGANDAHLVRVRSVPLGDPLRPIGWLLTLRDAGALGSDEVVAFHGMSTRESAMKQMFRVIEKVAQTEATVLVRGETGSGKELVAQALHRLSDRRDGPLRAINCAALPGNLLESELFGHVKGAFTGALRDTAGHIQLAHGGTLFLDEVAELPLELQAKLLRVLETRTVIPVGAREAIPVDVRIIAATHRALRKEVDAGRFRADLMYRLRVIPIFLPPLRGRPGDIEVLVEQFVAEGNRRAKRQIKRVTPIALEALERHDWPGNVRELRNVIEYAFAIGEGPDLTVEDLPPEFHAAGDDRFTDPTATASPKFTVTAADPHAVPDEARRILNALSRTGGNRDRAAKLLGWSRVTLWRHMTKHGLE